MPEKPPNDGLTKDGLTYALTTELKQAVEIPFNFFRFPLTSLISSDFV